MSARWADMRAAALAAEEAGFDGLWTWDHLRDPDVHAGGPGVPEAWTVLTALAEVTRRVSLGPLVLNVANRHPGVLANMAVDSWMPRRFAALSDRLTTQNGILLMGLASIAALLYTKGNVGQIVVMYSINVFLTFSLSMLAMLLDSCRARATGKRAWGRITLFTTGVRQVRLATKGVSCDGAGSQEVVAKVRDSAVAAVRRAVDRGDLKRVDVRVVAKVTDAEPSRTRGVLRLAG
jgi:hypothetical protein